VRAANLKREEYRRSRYPGEVESLRARDLGNGIKGKLWAVGLKEKEALATGIAREVGAGWGGAGGITTRELDDHLTGWMTGIHAPVSRFLLLGRDSPCPFLDLKNT